MRPALLGRLMSKRKIKHWSLLLSSSTTGLLSEGSLLCRQSCSYQCIKKGKLTGMSFFQNASVSGVKAVCGAISLICNQSTQTTSQAFHHHHTELSTHPFALVFREFFHVSLGHFVLVSLAFVVLPLVSSALSKKINWKERFRNDPFCVKLDTKLS